MREIYTAPSLPAAELLFDDFATKWRPIYPAMISSWETSWNEFIPFLEFPPELRKIVYTTNAIESLNARFRRAVRHRGLVIAQRVIEPAQVAIALGVRCLGQLCQNVRGDRRGDTAPVLVGSVAAALQPARLSIPDR